MKRECLQKFLSGFFVFCIALSFSISSFAAAFTGAYMTTETDPVTGQVTTVINDVNPTGQTYSGQNVIEINAYNNAPTLTNNTFNGSTDINPDFTSITSTGNAYNGSVDINYDGLGGTLDSNGDRFQSTTLTAHQSDISISNGTFNGSTTINANSVSLGSVSQMDTLLNEIYVIVYNLTEWVEQTTPTKTVTNPWTNQSVTIPLFHLVYSDLVWTGSAFTQTNHNVYVTYANALGSSFAQEFRNMRAYVQYLFGEKQYTLYTFTANGEHYSLTTSTATSTWRDVIVNRFDILIKLIDYYCNHFFQWYYPLDNILPEYWRYYNTDTAQQEEIGLAGLMYNISWYLGQMYVLQSASQSLDNMADQVEAITDTLEEAEQKENAVISSISTGINSFAPDIQSISAFSALSWCSNYLQQMFLALGTYGTVIMVGLLLGVCMQFIGYFRYK